MADLKKEMLKRARMTLEIETISGGSVELILDTEDVEHVTRLSSNYDTDADLRLINVTLKAIYETVNYAYSEDDDSVLH